MLELDSKNHIDELDKARQDRTHRHRMQIVSYCILWYTFNCDDACRIQHLISYHILAFVEFQIALAPRRVLRLANLSRSRIGIE